MINSEVTLLWFKSKRKILDSHDRVNIYTEMVSKFLKTEVGFKSQQIKIYKNKIGKPILKINKKFFNVSISHCDNYYFIALSEKIKIGIDIENISKKRNFLKIAKRYFSNQENFFICNAPLDFQSINFYFLWTAKEALLKLKSNNKMPKSKDLFLDSSYNSDKNFDFNYFIFKRNYMISIVCHG